MIQQEINQAKSKQLSSWSAYGICLLISTIFFFLFGFNSPIYTFNSDNDFHWFLTLGNALAHGKIPYRDLFEQKGPIVYFVFAFASFFPNPGIAILILEILSMSLFFFFTYKICKKFLNTFYSLLAIPFMAFAIFTCWCRMFSASTVEEFALPIYTYFLHCWLEFLTEKRHWNQIRSICLGICFAIMIWVKYTLIYFAIIPMIIWFVLSIRRRQYRTLLLNLIFMIIGFLIITAPILLFYILHHALDDLFYTYFYINLTAYGTTSILTALSSFRIFFKIGPVLIVLILYGVVCFSVQHWKERTGWLLLIAFLVNFTLLIYSSKKIAYYYGGLIPYSIFGIIYILKFFNTKLTLRKFQQWIYVLIVAVTIVLCIPFSVSTKEWGRNRNEYTPLVIADVIHDYEKNTQTKATLFCYRIWDFGFYNAAKIIPNNYFYANNVFDEDRFPDLYEESKQYIMNQTSDFVITELQTWENEHELLSQYYSPYTGDIQTSTYHYKKLHYFYYKSVDFILLLKK